MPVMGRMTRMSSEREAPGAARTAPLPGEAKCAVDISSSYKSSIKKRAVGILSTAVGAATFATRTKSVSGEVFMENDAYGDKELKQAAINNLKQRLRNKINESPELAKGFFELAITDGLGYQSSDGTGGLDGSITYDAPPGSVPLSFDSAVKCISSLKNELQETLSVSLADVTAYAGAEGCEAIGAPRIVVNLGRTDSKGKNKKEPAFDIWGEGSEASVASAKAAFTESGLSAKETTALLIAHGELRRTLKEIQAKAVAKAKVEPEEDDDERSELDDEVVVVPTSFGRRDEIWGPKLTDSFGNTYIANLLKAVKKSAPSEISLTLLDRVLIEDSECRASAQAFASSNKDFLEALPKAYQKLSTNGQTFLRAKD